MGEVIISSNDKARCRLLVLMQHLLNALHPHSVLPSRGNLHLDLHHHQEVNPVRRQVRSPLFMPAGANKNSEERPTAGLTRCKRQQAREPQMSHLFRILMRSLVQRQRGDNSARRLTDCQRHDKPASSPLSPEHWKNHLNGDQETETMPPGRFLPTSAHHQFSRRKQTPASGEQ